MSKGFHEFKHKIRIRCKKKGRGTDDSPFEPDLPPEILRLIPKKTEIGKTYLVWQVVKENEDGTLEVEVYHD